MIRRIMRWIAEMATVATAALLGIAIVYAASIFAPVKPPEAPTIMGPPIQYGTHDKRLSFDPMNLVDGSIWIETDTGSIYQWHALEAGEIYAHWPKR